MPKLALFLRLYFGFGPKVLIMANPKLRNKVGVSECRSVKSKWGQVHLSPSIHCQLTEGATQHTTKSENANKMELHIELL